MTVASRRSGAVAVAVAAWLLGLAAALALLGVGGYRSGFLWCSLVIGAGGAALLLRLLPSDTVFRGAWALTVLVLGAVMSAKLVDLGPPSRGRLQADLDHLRLPFFTETSHRMSGHSWCRPHCPVVSRTYRAPDVGATGTLGSVAVALEQRRLLTNSVRAVRRVRDNTLHSRTKRVDVTVTTRRIEPVVAPSGSVVRAGVAIVTIELRARR